MSGELKWLLVVFISVLVLTILSVLLATVLRRAEATKRYRLLDRYREEYGARIRELIDAGRPPEDFSRFVFPPRSLDWIAVEHVLASLLDGGKYESAGIALYDRLGYRAHYERKLGARDVIERSAAAERLGRMRCEGSVGKLLPLLDEENAEIVSVTLRALSKIGTPAALEAVLERLPRLHSRSLVTKKSVEQALLNFGPAAVPEIVRWGERYDDPSAAAFALEVLGILGPAEGLSFAFRSLGHADPEVRSKALKLIAAVGGGLPREEKEKVEPLLDDPVWFVRLQAARAVGALRHCSAQAALAKRLTDGKWQVRNAAATAIVLACEDPAAIFLETLDAPDRYAKESICEEIQKTGFVYRLIADLDPPDGPAYAKSRKILDIMASLGYATPLEEYRKEHPGDRIGEEIKSLVEAGADR